MVYGLRSAIHSVFSNESECARAMNWPRQRLNKITTGNKEPTVQELWELSNVLGKTVGEIAGFFLPSESTNG